ITRVEARVTWEDVDKAPLALFVETKAEFQQGLWPDPNAFLIGCLLPAWRAGERRVRVDGYLCPILRHNLKAALDTLQLWYPDFFGPMPVIETTRGFKARLPAQGQAVSLLSCGIDSLATLRRNKLYLPSDHPAAIRGVIVMKFDRDPEPSLEALSAMAWGRLQAVTEVAEDSGVDPIPVRTNIWWLANDGYFSDEKWHGAILSSIACFFSKRFQKAYIASADDIAHQTPWGAHPSLDPYYSSAHFQIEHHGVDMSRFQKTALVADWPIALQNIRVCQRDESGTRNCGSCEKCIKTTVALLALGKLKGSGSFPRDDVSIRILNLIEEYDMIHGEHQVDQYKEVIPALRKRGRDELADTIRKILVAYAEKQSKK
ncbi:hypothetical protein ACFL6S_36040, partial [Candidatus Poribacteria bacterium]